MDKELELIMREIEWLERKIKRLEENIELEESEKCALIGRLKALEALI